METSIPLGLDALALSAIADKRVKIKGFGGDLPHSFEQKNEVSRSHASGHSHVAIWGFHSRCCGIIDFRANTVALTTQVWRRICTH